MAGITAEHVVATDPAVAWLKEKAKRFSDDADELRATTDRAAKGLAALATAGFTAVGIANVGDFFPEPGEWGLALLFLWLGFVLMVGAVVAFVVRFWLANRPLALSARLAEMCRPDWSSPPSEASDANDADLGTPRRWVTDFLTDDECNEVARIYGDAVAHAAFAHGEESLAHYEWRADRLEREAVYTPDSPASARRLAQVERMRAEIEKGEQRAKLVIVRRRMNRVFNHRIAIALAIVFVVGLVMFAMAADYFDAEHYEKLHSGMRGAQPA